MCGIVAFSGVKPAQDILLQGLGRLEYRGYDSAGIAVQNGGGIDVVKCEGRLQALADRLERAPLGGTTGIGHTRWATHGIPSDRNAHPHTDASGRFMLVHNGIIENADALREELRGEGVAFSSDTDSEVIVHLVARHFNGDLVEALRAAISRLDGAYAVALMAIDAPGVVVGARKGSPLIIGRDSDGAFLASDAPALLGQANEVCYLSEGQLCRIAGADTAVFDADGTPVEAAFVTLDLDPAAAELEGFPCFMLKEIHQQPEVLRHVLRGRVPDDGGALELGDLGCDPAVLAKCSKIVIVACGTAWHSGLYGKYIIETLAKIPVEVETASEFRYRNSLITPETLLMPISQSGETADTLEAMRLGRSQGAKVVSLVNVVGSSIARESDGVFYTHAGPEIGVASTKAYSSQLMGLALLAVHAGLERGTLSPDDAADLLARLRAIPDKVQICLDRSDEVERVARNFKYVVAHSALFLGRTYNYPTALEGALKLKEISYIHAEGYAAGEMKHGPLALVTDAVPSVCIATQGDVYRKMISNIQEIQARRGIVLAIATDGDTAIQEHCDEALYVPECWEGFSPLVNIVPLQLFSYYIAQSRGCDVDKPRNLAKSVTVE